jgi:hypothetical protein
MITTNVNGDCRYSRCPGAKSGPGKEEEDEGLGWQ